MVEPDLPEPGGAAGARQRMVVVTVVGAVLAAALLFALVARAMTSGTGTASKSGDGDRVAQFDVGKAEDRAKTVDRSGPILFPDPRGGSRDIYVQHLGGKDWVAFEARAAGAARTCVLRWEQAARHFVDPCDGRIFPADGAGLVTFPARVGDNGRLVVDLSSPTTP